MDVGVTDEILNGVDYEESSSSEDEAQGKELRCKAVIPYNCAYSLCYCIIEIIIKNINSQRVILSIPKVLEGHVTNSQQ